MTTPAPLLTDLIPAYTRYLIGEQRRPSGRAQYLKTIKTCIRHLGHAATMDALDACAVRRYKEQLAARNLAPAVIINMLAAVRDFSRWAMAEGLRADDPTASIRRPSKNRPDPNPLYAHQAAALLHAMEEPPDLDTSARWYWRRNRLLVMALLYAGLRRSEATALRWRDVSFTASVLRVQGKGGRDRRVPLHPLLRAACEAISPHERADLERPLIGSPTGAPLTANQAGRIFHDWTATFKLDFAVHPHQLRHTFASHLVWNDVDLRTVQDLLGHAQLGTTEYYVKTDTRRSTAMVQRLPAYDPIGTPEEEQ